MISKAIGRLACALALLLLAGALVSGALVSGAAAAPATAPQVSGAWVQLSPVPGRPAAAYFTLRGGSVDDRLTGVTSTAATRVELHTSGMVQGMMHMAGMTAVAVPALGRVAFAPGGNHVMLYGLKPSARSVPLRLTFASGTTATVDAEARTAGR